ncbi:FtsX-like permease family protein [Streptomyces harbinensis]|uniref:FtsX-like permease family protein n=1 Tax=Streptomyces harbinensis TaxID=1176198 RepID=UPI00371FA188
MNGATGDGARSGARGARGARGRAGAAAVLARAALRHQRRSWRTVFVAVLATSLLLGCFALAVTTVALGRPAVERYAAAPVVVTADQTTRHRGAQAPLTERLRIPASVADLLRSVPEVARVVTDREFRVPADDGTTYPGRPWEAAELAPWELREGRAPEAAGEVVASAGLDLPVGARAAGYRVVGVADGPAALWFTAPEAARLGGQDTVDVIGVLPGPGVSTGALSTAVRAALDAASAVDARPADERPADDTGELRVLTGDGRGAAEALGATPLWRDLLALFGAISGTVLMVAGLVLATLITRALRHRAGELALLRAVGAQPGQLRATVCREATAVALPAALLGAALAVPVFALLWRPVTAQAATAGLALPVVSWALPAPLLTAALTVAAVALAALPATAASGRPATPRGSGKNQPPGGPAPDGGRAVPQPTAARRLLPQRRQPAAPEPPSRPDATGASASGAAAVPDGAAVVPPPEAGAERRPARLTEASAEPRVSGRVTLAPDDGPGHDRGTASPGSAVPADAGRTDTHGPRAGRTPDRLGGSRSTPGRAGAAADGPERGAGTGSPTTPAPVAPAAPPTPAAGSAGRRIAGLVVLGLGAASAGSAVALPGDGAAAAAGAAVVVMVIGCALLGPWIAGWVLGLLARPLRRLGGAGGWLAVAHGRADSARLGAAIVPIVLVTAFAVVQLGADASVRHATAEQARAAGSAEGALATTVLTTRSELGDPVIDRHPALGVTAEELRALDPGVRAGDLGALGPGTVAVGADRARALGAGVGDTLTLRYGDGSEARLRVVAVYERSLALGAFLLDRGQLAPHVTDPDAPPAPAPAQDLERRLSTAAVAAIAALALLAVCSTLTVITVARRPERDLLRRVGAGRGQLGIMLAAEAAVVAVTGLLLGAAVAALPLTAFSWATLHAPPHLPPGQAAALVAAVVLTTAAGSLLPALRR